MDFENPVTIRPAYREEWNYTMSLAYTVFMQFEAPIYTDEGIRQFYEFITDERLHAMFLNGEYYVLLAICDGRPVGMISLRARTHISLLFVDADYHRRGIGRMLIQAMQQYIMEVHRGELTVSAAPYAVEFYHKMGFFDLGPQVSEHGILYTPMKWAVPCAEGAET